MTTTSSERLVKVNEALKCAPGIPRNKWDFGKMREMCEAGVTSALTRLDGHKHNIAEFETKCRLRGVDEADIQKSVHQSFSHMHIQLLEQVINAKKSLKMMELETVEELTRHKIAILEEMVLEPTNP